ncbi:flagellin N-terminal domain protein [Selenomonas sp. FOBRC6]|uniref:flagellin N-terminal helical domain-containing protein n=1 Tax=Selenomonas sp. FOBRC6 TaxID=936572 RepID=UPI00027819A5|nr:flagellin [Selenomonas sp. FOBRC6]EJO22703.1 flagellin N-terminal domain protein [Selenomonas sp. FOBRC6]
MAMVVKNNMSAVNTLNTLNKNQSELSKSLQKVSSGMKINSAGDDASGMAISERMRVQIRALDQDDNNTKNGSALLRTAEGAVQSTIEILKTLKEKAINAANDTNTDEDRRLIQKEVDKLIDQIDENALTTYNGKYLIDGTKNGLVVGESGAGTQTSFTNMSLATNTNGLTQLVRLKRRDGNDVGIDSNDTLTASWVKNGVTYTGTLSPIGTGTVTNMISLITSQHATFHSTGADVGVDEYGRTVYTPDNQPALTIRARNDGVDGQVTAITFAVTDKEGKMRNEVNAVLDDFRETVRAQNPSPDNSLVLQTGTKSNQAVKVGFTDMRSVALGLQSADGAGWNHVMPTPTPPVTIDVVGSGPKIQVTTKEAANAAINAFQNALIRATDQAVAIGAVQNRLGFTSSNLVVASENVQASESTIRDADMAKEMTAYTKHNVLTQSAQAMLAQANQNSSAVLSLLQ